MNRKDITNILKRLTPFASSSLIGAPRRSIELGKYVSLFPENGAIDFFKETDYSKEYSGVPLFFNSHEHINKFTTFVAFLKKARVWGRNGAVIADGDYFIKDVAREFNKGMNIDHSIFYTIKEKKAFFLSGNTALTGTAGANIYYHWMLDILPRFGLLSKKIALPSIDHFVTEFTGLPFQQETIQKIGINLNKIIPSNENWNFHVTADNLWVPSLAGPIDQPSPYQIRYVRDLFKDCISNIKPYRKIYISRKSIGRRMIVNEEEIINCLSDYDFEVTECEKLSVAQQVRMFSEASVIICSHGSALTNLAFSHPSTKVLDIFNNNHINPCFWFISQILGLDYHYMQGKSVPIDINPKNDNTLVNTGDFKNKLKEIGLKDKQ